MFCGSVLNASASSPGSPVSGSSPLVRIHERQFVGVSRTASSSSRRSKPARIRSAGVGPPCTPRAASSAHIDDPLDQRREPLVVGIAELPAQVVNLFEHAQHEPIHARVAGPEDVADLDPLDWDPDAALEAWRAASNRACMSAGSGPKSASRGRQRSRGQLIRPLGGCGERARITPAPARPRSRAAAGRPGSMPRAARTW